MKGRDWAVLLGLVAIALAGYFAFPYLSSRFLHAPPAPEPASATAALPQHAPAEAAEAAPQYPMPADDADIAATKPALPTLGESDAGLRAGLVDIFQAEPIDTFLVPEGIVRRFVVMVDNLTEPSLPMRLRPIRKIGGAFMVQASADGPVISAANAARYAGIVEVLQLADVDLCMRLYRRYYPLFQSAYAELGRRGYFNDRLVVVIDHLLATPEVQEPLLLVQPKVFYEFADAELQTRSAGQKILLRVGSENAAIIKEKLRKFRAAITATPAQTLSPSPNPALNH